MADIGSSLSDRQTPLKMDLHREEYVAQSVEHRLQSPPSGSKRKRMQETVAYTAEVPEIGAEIHSPKRSRSNRYLSDRQPSAQPGSPQPGRGIRRIKGKYSLSALNRHQAPDDLRASKFKEGSMNDKPSEKPPSVFIRSPNRATVTPDEVNMEYLMDQYHDGVLEDSVEESARAPSRADTVVMSPALDHGTGAYRFGKMIASSFNPMNMWKSWSKVWDETRDEITIRNIEENRRKAAQKALAEQVYAEMKSAGQIKTGAYTAVKEYNGTEPMDEEDEDVVACSTRDSGVSDAQDKPLPDVPNRGPTPALDGQSERTLKSRKSLFSIRVPSISGTLKKTRSVYNLPEVNHQSSTSISPEKYDRPISGLSTLSGTLHRSHSRKDLSRQQKLSKRVSDLEAKLQDARRDLSTAISNASPLPDLPSRFEKYTPNFKLHRPKFVPSGNLPSLPSEGILFPSLRNKKRNLSQTEIQSEESHVPEASQSTIRAVDPDSTIRAHRSAVTTFEHQNFLAMDPASFMSSPTQAEKTEGDSQTQYADLDTKLKALEESHQAGLAARKPVKSKKRKSAGESGKLFKPAKDDNYANDDAEWDSEDAKPKKQRKISIRKTSKKSKAAAETTTGAEQSSAAPSSPVVDPVSPVVDSVIAEETTRSRSSMDSQMSHRSSILEPISEEEIIAVAYPKRTDSLAPPNTARGSRSRSRSPNPRSVVSKMAKEIAGHQDETPSKIRTSSPPASDGLSKPAEPINGQVIVKPGGSVPEMPASPQQKKRKATKGPKENFEWPEDVF